MIDLFMRCDKAFYALIHQTTQIHQTKIINIKTKLRKNVNFGLLIVTNTQIKNDNVHFIIMHLVCFLKL